MTITLEIPPEVEAGLRKRAEARGVSLDDYLQMLIATHAGVPCVDAMHRFSRDEELDRMIDELFDLVPLPPGVGASVDLGNWYR